MKIKATNNFASAKAAYQDGHEYDVTDTEGAEYVAAGLAIDLTPPPAPVEVPNPEEAKAAEPKAAEPKKAKESK